MPVRPPRCEVFLPFDALLALAAGVHRMLHLAHLGHQVGQFDQFRRGVAAGDDDMLVARPLVQCGHHVGDVDPAPLDRVGELVEHVEPVPLGFQVALDLRPTFGRLGGVVALVARPGQPRPALAHLVPGNGSALTGGRVMRAECPQRGLLADPPLWTLHELEHHHRPPGVPGAQRHPERGGGLALADPGVHGQDRLAAPFAGGEPVVGYLLDFSLWHQAALRVATARRPSADNWSRRRYSARSAAASRAARPRRTGPDSQSTTTAATPVRAAAAATGSAPAVARPSVTRISSARRCGSRRRCAATTRAAVVNPAARGVRPPVRNSRSRAAPISWLPVGGSVTSAPSPRKVTRPTLSRRWYAARSSDSTAPFTARIRCRAAIEPEASTTNSTKFASRPLWTDARRSSARSSSRPVRPRLAWCGAAARRVAARCKETSHSSGRRAPTTRPARVYAAERRPCGAWPPGRVSGTASSRARYGGSAAEARLSAPPPRGPPSPALASGGAPPPSGDPSPLPGEPLPGSGSSSGSSSGGWAAVRIASSRASSGNPGASKGSRRRRRGNAIRTTSRTSASVTAGRPCQAASAVAVRATTMSARIPSTSNAAHTLAIRRSSASGSSTVDSRTRACWIREESAASDDAQSRVNPSGSAS